MRGPGGPGGGRPRLLYAVNRSEFFLSHRLPVAEAAREAGWEVHVTAAERGHGEALRATGLPFHPIPLAPSGLHLLRERVTARALRRVYERLRPDLVHQVTLKPILYGGMAARRLEIGGVVNALTGLGHVFTATDLRTRILRRALVAGLRRALDHPRQVTIFQNPDDRDAFVRLGLLDPDDTVVIRSSGVDPERFRPAPEPPGPPVVLFPSRMLWTKGLAEFVEAARRLRADGVAARFVLAGAPDPDNPAGVPEETLRAWEGEGVVEWWGHRDDMPAVFAASHVVCLPSWREGLPRVLVEAAACARPIVTADVPGCREIVADGRNGLLVPVRDGGATAAAVGRLLAAPGLRSAMGRAGRRRVEEEFTLDRVVSRTLEVYDRLAARTRTAGGGRP